MSQEEMEFQRKRRLEVEREKLSVHPMFYKHLPTLPEEVQDSDVTQVLQQIHTIKKSFWNRFLMMFSWLSPSYRNVQRRIQELEKEILVEENDALIDFV